MSLIFVPTGDLSTSASEATSITSLDFGYIQAGENRTLAVRIGNTFPDTSSYVVVAPAGVTVSPAEGSLSADEISDTTSITIELPLDVSTGERSLDLVTKSAGKNYTLRLDYYAVGVNVARDSEYPERRTSFTDQISDTIVRASEPLRLLTFTPIPYDPNDRRVLLDFSRNRKLDFAGDHRFIAQNVETQLDPLNETWGYVRSESIIPGSWQDEFAAIQVEFESLNTVMTYTATAQLYVPAEYEFPRMWGLFKVGRDPDTDQYKRTVYVVERRGEFWGLHNIYSRWRGNELAYFAIDLVQISSRGMGSPDFYNPFAWTYRLEHDKPYAMFSIDPPELATIFTSSTSGSNAVNPSLLNTSGIVLEPNPSMMPNTSDAVTSPPAPQPVGAYLDLGDETCLIEFDLPIQDVTINHAAFTGRTDTHTWSGAAASILSTTECLITIYSLVLDASGPQCIYDGTGGLIGENGVPVESFDIVAEII